MAKDSPRTTAGELSLKKKIVKLLIHHMLFGRVSRKMILAHPKTNSSIISYQTRLELQMCVYGWMDGWMDGINSG